MHNLNLNTIVSQILKSIKICESSTTQYMYM